MNLISLIIVFLLMPILTNAQLLHQVRGKAISPDLFGIFFEDLNYAADGGLYAELVQNRSFEYSPADQDQWNRGRNAWNPFTAWMYTTKGYGYVIRAGEEYNFSVFLRQLSDQPIPVWVKLLDRKDSVIAETRFETRLKGHWQSIWFPCFRSIPS